MCFTSDLDWALEPHVAALLDWFADREVALQPFVTHESEAVRRHYGTMPELVGLHPYLAEDSTHGTSAAQVAANVSKFWPEARSWRGHRYCDSEDLIREMWDRGCRYDANLFAELQSIPPLRTQHGMERFATGWEDEVWFRGPNPEQSTQVAVILGWLMRPGVHVLNVHPQWFALNLDSHEAYEVAKAHDWDVPPQSGFGVGVLVKALVQGCQEIDLPMAYLDQVWEWL